MKKALKRISIMVVGLIGTVGLLYLTGLVTQFMTNYQLWMNDDGFSGKAVMKPPDRNFFSCISNAFTISGLKCMGFIILIGSSIYLYIRFHERFDGRSYDERGFKTSNTGTYGTAGWMSEKEMREELEVNSIEKAKGIILGEYGGKAVCMPEDTRLNRHIAIFGASGTMKSRSIIRNALFQALKRGESVVITDPKGELYGDTAELYRKNGYDVRVFNLVDPEHSDSWNCMSDLNGNTLMAQVLTNVIIGNTSSGKGDHFWDNGEGNLLKALILYIDYDKSRSVEEKTLPAVYQMLTGNTKATLSTLFGRLPADHPAKAPFNLFFQSSDTVKEGIISGLGTRLQVLQNKAVCKITSRSDIDLARPAKKKCAYYIILSDQDTTMAFLSSLFFSFLFIQLTRYADSRPLRKCDVPVNLILDEFNNVGRIGGAADGSDFARTLSVIRSRDIRVMLAVQSLGQLQNRYPNNLWAEIVGNCDIQLMLGCTDDVTAKYFSERSGEMSIEVETIMTTRQTIAVAQVIPQYRQSQGQGKRKLLTTDEVLRLPNSELLCIVRGCNILKLNKLDYTKHPLSKEVQVVNIMDYIPAGDEGLFCQTDFENEYGKKASKTQALISSTKSSLYQTGIENDKASHRTEELTYEIKTKKQTHRTKIEEPVYQTENNPKTTHQEDAVHITPNNKKTLYISADNPPADF